MGSLKGSLTDFVMGGSLGLGSEGRPLPWEEPAAAQESPLRFPKGAGCYGCKEKGRTCGLERVSSFIGIILFAFSITLIIGSLLISFVVYLIFTPSIYTHSWHL